jgi:hypothetical protein
MKTAPDRHPGTPATQAGRCRGVPTGAGQQAHEDSSTEGLLNFIKPKPGNAGGWSSGLKVPGGLRAMLGSGASLLADAPLATPVAGTTPPEGQP